ncbi:MAG: hypothetical protein NZM13_12555 [Cyclobacteriaceae bacterium]|nr:hypothetical protein [Cyclobacteriaceae bacterium]
MITNLVSYLKKNWIKTLLLFAAAIYVVSGYGVEKTIQIVSVLVCMFVTILNVIEIYIEGKHFFLFKEWSITAGRIAYLIISSITVVALVVFVLPDRSIIFAFSFAGLTLAALLIYEVFSMIRNSKLK